MTSPLYYDCQKYDELDGVEDVRIQEMVGQDPSRSLFQLKYDGIWARIVVEENCAYVYSKTGQLKESIYIDSTLPSLGQWPVVLLGEYMYGSQWSQQENRSGVLFIFDCVSVAGSDISGEPYETRYRKAIHFCRELGRRFLPVACYSILNCGGVWLEIEKRKSHEGLIFRRWDSPYSATLLKLKREVEDDFVILGVEEGQGKHAGRLGALLLGQFNPATEDIEFVCKVGGGFDDLARQTIWDFREKVTGHVCLVRGKGRFDSGAIRHPNFVRLRSDKLPTECILKRQSE